MIDGSGLTFSGIQGLEEACHAVMLPLVDRRLGGVLIRGTRGTGKSTLAAATAGLLPEGPVVRVPLSASEDNLLGSHDLQRILAEGEARLRRGLLARADGGVILADEINLLPDRLVDLVLDCLASGRLIVERSGVSLATESRFTLLATMDPAEGNLRPQLLDRFALSVTTPTLADPGDRAALLRRRLALRRGFSAVVDEMRDRDDFLRRSVREAQARMDSVKIPGRALAAAVYAGFRLNLDGHRPEKVLLRASVASAALMGKRKVGIAQLRRCAVPALGHRTRFGGLERPPDRGEIMQALSEGWAMGGRWAMADRLNTLADMRGTAMESLLAGMRSVEPSATWSDEVRALRSEKARQNLGGFPEHLTRKIMKQLLEKAAEVSSPGRSGGRGVRMESKGRADRGRRTRVLAAKDASEIDPLQTVIAAAAAGKRLPLVPLEPRWWRKWERSSRPRATAMLLVDASRSSREYLQRLSGLLHDLFEQHFDPLSKVGLISITGASPVLHFPPTRNRLRVYGRIAELESSGYTPLAESLAEARRILRRTSGGAAANCFVLLVSDCCPEPIPLGYSDPWSSQPYARVRQEARRLGTDGIPALIVDPMPVTELIKSQNAPGEATLEGTPGRRLGRFLERVTGGALIHAPPEIIRQPNRLVQLVNRLVDGDNPWKALTHRLDTEIGGMSGDRGGVPI